MALSNGKDFAVGQFDRLQGFYPRVEGKASFLFALNVGMAGVLAANLPVKNFLTHAAIPAWVSLLLLAFSTYRLFGTFFPHLKGAKHKGLIYFGDIAALSSDDYIQRMKAYTDAELEHDALCQIWRNSEILQKKYDRAKYAFQATGLALVPWLLFISIVASSGTTPIFKAG